MSKFDLTKPISLGSDHAGFELKKIIKEYINGENLSFEDFGTHTDSSCDYPDYSHIVAEKVKNNENSFGVLICGSANGVCISANKHINIRATICWNEEIAKLARQHNNSNILCLPSKFVNTEMAIKIFKTFIQTEFEGGRHLKRINKINPN